MSTDKSANLSELIAQSMSDMGVSSSEHAISSFAAEAKNVEHEEFFIPSSYGIDTLKCIGVNVNTIYVYWEITDRLLASNGVDGCELLVKLFDTNGESELMNFFITDKISNRFLNIHLPNRAIYAKIGAMKDGKFIELLRSNTFFTPSDEITFADDEIWMSKSERMKEILKASAPSGFNQSSSFGIIKELEFLRKNNESIRTNVSSLTSVNKEKE